MRQHDGSYLPQQCFLNCSTGMTTDVNSSEISIFSGHFPIWTGNPSAGPLKLASRSKDASFLFFLPDTTIAVCD